MNKFDTIIIGYGPAGISCSIYLKRYNHNVLVIGKDGGSLEKATKIENYYGIDSISGKDLVLKGIDQAKNLGIEVVKDEIIDITFLNGFSVKTKNSIYYSKTLVLALGAPKNTFSLAKDFEGKGVSYCATCDGFFYRKKRTALIGSKEFMLNEFNVLSNMINDLTVFTNGEKLEVILPENTKIVYDKIIKFDGKDKLEKIVTTNDSYDIDGAFIALGSQSSFTIAKHLGIALNDNYIKVNSNYETNIKGLYAIGDCIDGLKQVVKAASDGAICSTNITKYLKTLNN